MENKRIPEWIWDFKCYSLNSVYACACVLMSMRDDEKNFSNIWPKVKLNNEVKIRTINLESKSLYHSLILID